MVTMLMLTVIRVVMTIELYSQNEIFHWLLNNNSNNS